MKYIKDPIHGAIEVDEKLIDNPFFQRLRYIIQNGMAYLVFPAMRHSRFEHSLGTYYVASKMVEKVNCNINKEIIKELALYHDIGHMPFSHTFEYSLDVLRLMNKYKHSSILRLAGFHKGEIAKFHEAMGERILREMDKEEVAKLMREIYIEGAHGGTEVRIAKLIVNSELDADRLDYLQRDSYYSGAKFGLIDPDRLLNIMEISEGGYIFPPKAIDDLEHFLLARFHMYSSVYNHPVIEIYNRVMAYFIAYAINEDDIQFPDNIYDIIDFTDDSILSVLKSKKYKYYHFYDSIINRRPYMRSTLEGAQAKNLIKILGKDEVYEELIIKNKGKVVIGENKIETKYDNIKIRRKMGKEEIDNEIKDEEYIVKPPSRYRVHIGVYDEKTKKEVIDYFKAFGILLNFDSKRI